MSPEAWTFFTGLTATAAAILREQIKARRTMDRTEKHAKKAAELSQPTGNGFANRVEGALGELKAGQDELRQRIDQHITEQHPS